MTWVKSLYFSKLQVSLYQTALKYLCDSVMEISELLQKKLFHSRPISFANTRGTGLGRPSVSRQRGWAWVPRNPLRVSPSLWCVSLTVPQGLTSALRAQQRGNGSISQGQTHVQKRIKREKEQSSNVLIYNKT